MPAQYSVILYDGCLRQLARRPVVAVDAGQVANDVAQAQVEIVPRTGLYADDVNGYLVQRFEAGRVTNVGYYGVAQMIEKVDGIRRTWQAKGVSPLAFFQQRDGPNLATALSGAAAASAKMLMDAAWRQGDTPATVDGTRADVCSPNATTQTGVLEPLATIKDLARAAETNYGMDLRVKLNYDLVAVPQPNALTLRPVVWVGEYGADRRVGRGVQPVLLYLTRIAQGWQATDDRGRQVTRLVGTGSASSYTNTRALENPYGNRREKSVSASSGGASRVNSQARTTLFEGRPITRIQADLVLPPDRYGLALGDVFSVNVNGAPGDAWLNVVQYTWNASGEKVTGRIDVEVQKWT